MLPVYASPKRETVARAGLGSESGTEINKAWGPSTLFYLANDETIDYKFYAGDGNTYGTLS